jgi:hypothetical protein
MIATAMIVAALAGTAPNVTDAEGVACVVERTLPADRLAIAESALGAGEARARSVEAEDRFSGHLAACAERFGWDDAQGLRISTLGIATMVRDAASARLAGAGIDRAALDLWFDRQSEDFRTRAFRDLAEEEAGATIMTLENGVLAPGLLEAHADLIGGYLAMRVLAERLARGLPVD